MRRKSHVKSCSVFKGECFFKQSVCLFTSQGVQGVVQVLGVAVDEFQSALSVGLGNVDSVQQLVELLQTQTYNMRGQ